MTKKSLEECEGCFSKRPALNISERALRKSPSRSVSSRRYSLDTRLLG